MDGEKRRLGNANMTIRIRFFASLAEEIGIRSCEIEFRDGLNIGTVWSEVTGQDNLPETILCAKNHSYCEPNSILTDLDEVAFFPPVTGG